MRDTLRQHVPYLYGGHAYCVPGRTRIDEAYFLLSGKLVRRVVDTPNLLCGGHAGKSAGWWFTPGNMANTDGDVRWVNDPRLDHHGLWWGGNMTNEQHSRVCVRRMGVHHTYVEDMALLWAEAKNNPGPMPRSKETAFQYPEYECGSLSTGMGNATFFKDNTQLCRLYKPPPEEVGTLHCGAEGC